VALAETVADIVAAAREASSADRTTPRQARREPPWPERPLTFENAGFRVRFAATRAATSARHALDLNSVAPELDLRPVPGPLDDPRERAVVAMLGELPSRIRRAAERDDDKPLRRFLERLADAYHDVFEGCPALPRGDEPATGVHRARLELAAAVAEALGVCLPLLGVTPLNDANTSTR
jgi:arginyl-tRNA synthetase